ncbi:RNA-directed DNA polymerase, eukaryota, Reverse transcriptase zinc-binding domain protein [Artemisia annua]|uniref:RNA-directed DNA polymerase, eukaryota, Reverse transcriptase zinc-binding domain protein n=1 Tax=Artemisia annua TaxID=35608 RepID=A0A2U1L646_ARTAN|nr:RNA-directed DNA polymerase, eukaryota, Reverse transcriptase zinc-binding domain protein [Artemisia annua]
MFLMISVASWNIKGLNRVPKQSEVREVMNRNQLCICAILESHVTIGKLSRICNKVFRNWQWTSNGSSCEGGAHIILGWDPDVINLMVITHEEQVLHCMAKSLITNMQFFVSFIYVDNDYIRRRILWKNLLLHKWFVGVHPWVIMGDFNASLCIEDSSIGSSRFTIAMSELRNA